MRFLPTRRPTAALATALVVGSAAAIGATAASGSPAATGIPGAPQQSSAASPRQAPAAAGGSFRARVFASGATIMHGSGSSREAVSHPDDLTALGGRIFVAFQNGVGPQGQASTTRNSDSTVVEFTRAGHEVRQWDIAGHCDGLEADRALGRVIATVNEDAHSSLYLLNPSAKAPINYHFARPLPSKGGTDAIDIYGSKMLISASAPGTTGKPAPQPQYPAVYVATLKPRNRSVVLKPLFFDESAATIANRGHDTSTKLALTDPDSNETVPTYAARFGGDFVLDSQGDREQIFVSGVGTHAQKLEVLKLSGSIDDSAWPSDARGSLYVSDNSGDTIDVVTGRFRRGEQIVAETPCDANGAPATCPAKGFPAHYLATLNPLTGQTTAMKVAGSAPAAQGLLFMP